MEIHEILSLLGFELSDSNIQVTPFRSDEDDSEYSVWKIIAGEKAYVLKQAKGCELEIYRTFFEGKRNVPGEKAFDDGKTSGDGDESDIVKGAVPELYGTVHYEGQDYLLMEYIDGEDLQKCDRTRLQRTLDALIALQDVFWENHEPEISDYRFEESLGNRKRRGQYLNDRELEAAYEKYLQLFQKVPRTLCHDDFLPFNVLVSKAKAVLIDWEVAGMLPYPTPLARLIAHSSEDENAFFTMSKADKAFAVQYYYDRLVRGKGISYEEYRMTLDYFLLYEYCEWIMLGNRYEDADMERYREYFARAKELIRAIAQNP